MAQTSGLNSPDTKLRSIMSFWAKRRIWTDASRHSVSLHSAQHDRFYLGARRKRYSRVFWKPIYMMVPLLPWWEKGLGD